MQRGHGVHGVMGCKESAWSVWSEGVHGTGAVLQARQSSCCQEVSRRLCSGPFWGAEPAVPLSSFAPPSFCPNISPPSFAPIPFSAVTHPRACAHPPAHAPSSAPDPFLRRNTLVHMPPPTNTVRAYPFLRRDTHAFIM
eukprot:366422-Chlamydomonas_euryale.AAC.5